MQEMYKISIAESISPRLGYRSSVAELFKLIEHSLILFLLLI